MFFKKRIESDDQIVERVRKQIKKGRKVAIGLFVFALVFIFLSFVVLTSFFKIVKSFIMDPNIALAGIGLGMIFGLIITLLMAMSVKYFHLGLWFLTAPRESKLLLKYYDQLNPSGENKK